MTTTGGLAASAEIDIGGAVRGVLAVGGHVLGHVSVLGGVETNGFVAFGSACQQNEVGTLAGYVQIGSATGPVNGQVWANGSIGELFGHTGTLEINGTVGSTGAVQIGDPGNPYSSGNVAGVLTLSNGLDAPLHIKGMIADAGSVETTGAVGSSGTIEIGAPDDPNSSGDVAGDLSVADLNAPLIVKGKITSTGDVQLTGGLDSAGYVQIGDPNDPNTGDVLGSLAITGSVAADPNDPRIVLTGDVGAGTAIAKVVVDGQLLGGLAVNGQIAKSSSATPSEVQINGDVGYGGYARIGSHVVGKLTVGDPNNPNSFCNLKGYVRVDGDVTGSIEVTGTAGDGAHTDVLAGYVQVYGAFGGAGLGDPERRVYIHRWYDARTPLGPTAYVAMDYDASGDTWPSSAAVVIGDPNNPSNVYRGNTADKHIWRITCFRGDAYNDGAVNFADINPFTMGLNYPDQYALTYPGLGDSRVVHGDANCDGVFNSADINPFIALLFQPPTCCDLDYEQMNFGWDGDGADGGYELTPEELAAQLMATVLPEMYDDLLNFVTIVIEGQEGAAKEYWEAVYAALTE
jgi:hypothetical protein